MSLVEAFFTLLIAFPFVHTILISFFFSQFLTFFPDLSLECACIPVFTFILFIFVSVILDVSHKNVQIVFMFIFVFIAQGLPDQ